MSGLMESQSNQARYRKFSISGVSGKDWFFGAGIGNYFMRMMIKNDLDVFINGK